MPEKPLSNTSSSANSRKQTIWGTQYNSCAELLQHREEMSLDRLRTNVQQNQAPSPTTKQPPPNTTQAQQNKQSKMAPNGNSKRPAPQSQVEIASNASTESRNTSPSMPPKKKFKLNFSKPGLVMVDVNVGPDGTNFQIHKNAICACSPHFRKILEACIEGEAKVILLPDVDPKVFGLFNNFIYTEELEHADSLQPTIMELAHLWTHASDWNIPSLQNAAMMQLIPLLQSPTTPAYPYNGSVLEQLVNHAYSVPKFQTINSQSPPIISTPDSETATGDLVKEDPTNSDNTNGENSNGDNTNNDISNGGISDDHKSVCTNIPHNINKNTQLRKLAAETTMRCGSLLSVPASQWSGMGYPDAMLTDLVDVLVLMVSRLKGGAKIMKFSAQRYLIAEDE